MTTAVVVTTMMIDQVSMIDAIIVEVDKIDNDADDCDDDVIVVVAL